MTNKKLFKYLDPDDIQINEADLKLKFREFREAVKSCISLLDLFIIIPAWLPIFFSEFKDFYGIPGAAVVGAYAVAISIATLAWLFRIRFSVIRLYKKAVKKDGKWLGLHEDDPYKKVAEIKSECGRGN